jgi:copper chaperone NosL
MTTGPISRMPGRARLLTLLAALLLGVMYLTPLWSVRLVAPQYPEGLGMYIRLHTVEGMKEHDLRNINSLNHYIGMKAIEPDAIPELRYMPWIAGGLIVAGIGVALWGRRRLLVGWLAAFVLLGVAGLADFYRWGYDYGHNLDAEQAIIVVPGMTYQPPLVGTKQLLNFTATSLPAAGAIAGGVSMLLGAAALFFSYGGLRRRGAIGGLALAATACAPPMHIAFGSDSCVECRMVITDRRFAAVLQTETGKALAFDSVDCLLEYLQDHTTQDYRGTWVTTADHPGAFIAAERAQFVQDGVLRPPMGNLVAYASVPGHTLSWAELRSSAVAHAR